MMHGKSHGDHFKIASGLTLSEKYFQLFRFQIRALFPPPVTNRINYDFTISPLFATSSSSCILFVWEERSIKCITNAHKFLCLSRHASKNINIDFIDSDLTRPPRSYLSDSTICINQQFVIKPGFPNDHFFSYCCNSLRSN